MWARAIANYMLANKKTYEEVKNIPLSTLIYLGERSLDEEKKAKRGR